MTVKELIAQLEQYEYKDSDTAMVGVGDCLLPLESIAGVEMYKARAIVLNASRRQADQVLK